MLITVFGDLHGRLPAAYDAVAHWEHHYEEQIRWMREARESTR